MDYSTLTDEFIQSMYQFYKSRQQKEMSDFLKGGAFILQFLSQAGRADVQPNEISAEMSISAARIATALGSLEEKGLIAREASRTDRRRILVSLTPKGKEAAELQQHDIHQNIMALLHGLGERDAKEYIRITRRLIDIAGQINGQSSDSDKEE